MLMLTGQKAILPSRQARFQIVDVVATMRPLTKLSRQIVRASIFRRSYGRPSVSPWRSAPAPCIWSFPEDIAAEEADDVALVPPHAVGPCRYRVSLDRARAA